MGPRASWLRNLVTEGATRPSSPTTRSSIVQPPGAGLRATGGPLPLDSPSTLCTKGLFWLRGSDGRGSLSWSFPSCPVPVPPAAGGLQRTFQLHPRPAGPTRPGLCTPHFLHSSPGSSHLPSPRGLSLSPLQVCVRGLPARRPSLCNHTGAPHTPDVMVHCPRPISPAELGKLGEWRRTLSSSLVEPQSACFGSPCTGRGKCVPSTGAR